MNKGNKEEVIIENDPKDSDSPSEEEDQTTKIINIGLIVLSILALLGIVAAIIVSRPSVPKPTPIYSFDELYQKTLDGQESEINYQYGKFVFAKIGSIWQTLFIQQISTDNETIVQREILLSLYHDPKSIEYIPVDENVTQIMSKGTLYTSFLETNNSLHAIAGVEIRKLIGPQSTLIRKNTLTTLYKDTNSTKYPFADCNNATEDIGVIEFRIGPEAKVIGNESCVQLYATTDKELIKVADRFLLEVLGIMK